MEIYGPRFPGMSNNEKKLEQGILDYEFPPGIGVGIELFAVEQYELINPNDPDWPYHADFMLCMVSTSFGQATFSYLFMEADDFYFHVKHRARDYKRDAYHLWQAPTIRFDSESIYKEPYKCVYTAVIRLMDIHDDQIRQIRQEFSAQYEHMQIAVEVQALRKEIRDLRSSISVVMRGLLVMASHKNGQR